QDKSYIAAQRVFAEGERLRAQGTKESLLGALDRYEAVLPHWRARGDKEGEANTLNSIGAVYISFGDNQRGLEFLDQSLQLWRTVGNRYWEVATLNSIGNVYNSIGNNQTPIDYNTHAIFTITTMGD